MADKITLTVATPEPDRDDATYMATALGWLNGWSPDEWEHAFTAQYQDAQGNLYRVMSCPVGVGFVAGATVMGPITRPPQDVEPYRINLTGARRAQAKLVTWTPQNAGPIPAATPASIVAIAGPSGVEAIAAMGLAPIPEDDL